MGTSVHRSERLKGARFGPHEIVRLIGHGATAIGVLDVGVEDGVPYLVMELLRGTDLRGLLADAAPLSLEHALAFVLPLASALQHAHEAGVLHRDLKPANIFLSRDVRDDVVPKLLDFGLSKVVAGVVASHKVTDAGTRDGFPLVSFHTDLRWR